jgi:hypothetical protein
MKIFYCLMHSYNDASGEPEDKILAYFETEDEAESAKSSYIGLPGFSRHPAGFIVDKIQLGRLYWQEGFETVIDNEPI